MVQKVSSLEALVAAQGNKISQLENAGQAWTRRVDEETRGFQDAVQAALSQLKALSEAQLQSLKGELNTTFQHVKEEFDNRAAQSAQTQHVLQDLYDKVQQMGAGPNAGGGVGASSVGQTANTGTGGNLTGTWQGGAGTQGTGEEVISQKRRQYLRNSVELT